MRYNGRMNAKLEASSMDTCESYLKMMQEMGVRVGDFYLLLGRAWEAPVATSPVYPKGQPKQCYRNAFTLAADFPDLVYCEGFVQPEGLIPIHHAWCVDAKGMVVDTTWNACGVDYFGVALDFEFCAELIQRNAVWGLLGDRVPAEFTQTNPTQYLHKKWLNPTQRLAQWEALMVA